MRIYKKSDETPGTGRRQITRWSQWKILRWNWHGSWL